ncbi:MAG: type IV pilus twitching motility protein PilT [Firmicutes bacterium]|nr:type IV pilus twitching motility protein PilT [Bacillota bacterium]
MACLLDLLQLAREKGASDLHLTVGRPPVLRLHGDLVQLDLTPLSAADTAAMLAEVASNLQAAILQERGEVDFACSLTGLGRFRINAFRQQGSISIACRLIPQLVPKLDQLGLPPIVAELTQRRQGLILVTGPTGSGKSTTLAAMIDKINSERATHILTIEDPIEFLYHHKLSLVNQREVGADTESFASGLRAALRQDPDVILIGEMRDLETTAAAVSAAETGHLVLASLHTPGAAQTIDRILDIFPPHQQPQIRSQLASVLQAVIWQQLLPRADQAGRVAAAEVLLVTPAIRNLIRERKAHQIPSLMQTGKQLGMQTMEQALLQLYQRGLISGDQLDAYSPESALLSGLLGSDRG